MRVIYHTARGWIRVSGWRAQYVDKATLLKARRII
jgi:hypothetical protein